MGLESIVENLKKILIKNTAKLSENPIYNYSVDVLSGWIYYTPTYALQELAAGKDVDSIIKTRLIGLAAHAIAMRPIGLLRNYFAKKWNVTQDSSLKDKVKLNFFIVTPVQTVVYAGMLIGGMAWSGNYDLKSSLYAWGVGIGLGALHSVPYGFVQDKVRKLFGVKPAITKSGRFNS